LTTPATTWNIGAFESWYTMKVLINNFREFDIDACYLIIKKTRKIASLNK